ncbi:DUF6048 family protein [Winogradskyella flava]|uniref:Outer membrane protein beta-barrel domain-containing protein n=1 Tax=Winogradskyella flava TaxID=1884876 RepID=A0A842IUE8_9FLAO|nr:DUF6048 family protein [Winogradskyella flava]MBC2846792.1 hypothetical protein [Winogradskyella flava]
MSASSIKILITFLLCSTIAIAQQQEKKTEKDTLIYKQKYGLRLGADISKLARTFFDDAYTGVEIMGDYRLTKRIYLAGEIGNEERTIENEVLNNTTKGSYFKGGIDLNFYKNWLDMENMIYVGFRGGASTFSQTLNSYDIYNINNQYWDEQFSVEEGTEFKGLTAIWGEILIGMKAEVFNNFYAGINAQLKGLITETAPNNFENLYIPGFNRTFDSGRFGVGFGFNLSYLVPIFKKDKIVVQEKEAED